MASLVDSIPVIDVSCLEGVIAALREIQFPNAPKNPEETEHVAAVVASWAARDPRVAQTAREIVGACTDIGFFYVRNYPMRASLEAALDAASREFFALPDAEKMEIAMARGGRAWRGYFPVGDELTSGRPDIKEGLYLARDRPAAQCALTAAGAPMHGLNLWPRRPLSLRPIVEEYFAAVEAVAQGLMALVALGLGLHPAFFLRDLTRDPLTLFRIFAYPPVARTKFAALPPAERARLNGVSEHVDYGLLTCLLSKDLDGLEVRRADGQWIRAPQIPDTLVVNIGDALEALTSGLFVSTLHRVRSPESDRLRVSMPFFFDPQFTAPLRALPLAPALQQRAAECIARRRKQGLGRWDKIEDVTVIARGQPYSSHILSKVAKVFPDLAAKL